MVGTVYRTGTSLLLPIPLSSLKIGNVPCGEPFTYIDSMMRKFTTRREPHLRRRTLPVDESYNESIAAMTTSAEALNKSLTSLLMAQDIVEGSSMVAPEILPDLIQSYSLDHDASPCAVPSEVTALVDVEDVESLLLHARNLKPRELDKDAFEVEQLNQALEEAQQQIQRQALELGTSRSQVAELLKHNRRLMVHLQDFIANDDASEEYGMLKLELKVIKAALFCGVLYLCWGGRADTVGLLTLVWLMIDYTS
jgi:hypothetical protein